MRPAPEAFALDVRVPGAPPRSVAVTRSPFVVGRGSDASLRLDVPGVWDRHLVLEVDRVEGLLATACEGALARVRGRTEALAGTRVRTGEEIEVGGAVIRVVLAPVRRRWQGVWEWLLWSVFVGVGLAQGVLLGWLLAG